jgi:hypothetical protein
MKNIVSRRTGFYGAFRNRFVGRDVYGRYVGACWALIVVLVVCGGTGCSRDCQDTPNGADLQLTGECVFDSEFPMRVFAVESDKWRVQGLDGEWGIEVNASYIGTTPTEAPLQIPPCIYWEVIPDEDMGPVDLYREMAERGIPGLILMRATDEDFRQVAELTELRALELAGARITDEGLTHLSGMTALRVLGLANTDITDEELSYLSGLRDMRRLDLRWTRISDSGLAHLKGMSELRWLSLIGGDIGDAGLAHLAGITELRTLHLAGTGITDDGLAHLAGLTELRGLNLRGTGITDEGLEYLADLSKLQMLNLQGTLVMGEGLAHLARRVGKLPKAFCPPSKNMVE